MIPLNEYNLGKAKQVMTASDVQELLEYRDVFIKFLDKSRFAYQLELSKGTVKGREGTIYRALEVIDELKASLVNAEKAFKKMQDDIEANKKK